MFACTSKSSNLFICRFRDFSTKSTPFIEKKSMVATKGVKFPPKMPVLRRKSTQKFKNLLVLDFEATCQHGSLGPIQPIQEIIEFPILQLSTADWTVKRRFHEYVRPTVNPQISSFCTGLTGIIQEMVDDKLPLSDVIQKFDEWVRRDKDLVENEFAFVSCGDWDLKVALPNEANYKNISLPSYFNKWINVKKSYAAHTGHFAKGMPELLRIYNLELIGRHHSGIDDVTNITEIVKCLGKDGHCYTINGYLNNMFNNNSRRNFRDPQNAL